MNKKLTKSLVFVLVLAAALIALGTGVFAADGPVAKIGDTEYPTLAEAVAEAQDGNTIELIADCSSSETITINKVLTLDLKGFTFTSTATDGITVASGTLTVTDSSANGSGKISHTAASDDAVWVKSGGTLILEKGTIESDIIAIYNSGTLVVNGGTVTGDYAGAYNVRGTATVNDGTVSGDYGIVICGDGTASSATLTVNGGTISGTGDNYAISGNGTVNDSENNGGTVINITGGTITSPGDAAIYQPQNGVLNISGGTITGKTGIYQKSGQLNITGGTINGTGDAVTYAPTGDGSKSTGDGVVIDNCGYPGGAPTASISGGTINSANAKAVASYASGENNQPIEKFISGGTFSSKPDEAYLAEGTMAVKNGDKWTVGQAADVAVAKIGDALYASLQKALDAAHEQDGDVTVTLLKDITEVAVIHQKAGQNLTLDGGGKTMTATLYIDGDGRYEGTDTLTIQNLKFAYDSATYDDAFIDVPSTKTTGKVYTTGKYNYAHNVTVKNCDFAGEGTTTVAFRVASGAGANKVTLENLTVTNGHSFAQLVGVKDLTVTGCTATGVKNGINISGGDGTGTITNTTIASNETEGYTVRLKDASGMQVTLSGNTFSGGEGLVNEATGGATYTVESGTYTGPLPTDASKISISGGTYSIEPAEATIVEGKVAVQQGDVWIIGALEDYAVAKIGDTLYATLAKAVAAAQNGDTITMIADETISVTDYAITIPAGKNIVLDLNGKTVTGSCETSGTSALIRNLGTLTICDSSQDQSGKLIGGADPTWTWDGSDDYTGSYASNLIRNEGTLTVNGGTLYNASSGSAAYAIDNYGSGKVTINGGTVDAKKASAIRMFYNNGGKVEVTGGTVGHYNSASDRSYMGIQVMGGTDADVVVSGGTVAGLYPLYSNGSGDSSVLISGGTFDGDSVGFSSTPDNISITGGTFLAWAGTWGEQTGFISGGLFSSQPDASYIVPGKVAVQDGNMWKIGTLADALTITAVPQGNKTLGNAEYVDAELGDTVDVKITLTNTANAPIQISSLNVTLVLNDALTFTSCPGNNTYRPLGGDYAVVTSKNTIEWYYNEIDYLLTIPAGGTVDFATVKLTVTSDGTGLKYGDLLNVSFKDGNTDFMLYGDRVNYKPTIVSDNIELVQTYTVTYDVDGTQTTQEVGLNINPTSTDPAAVPDPYPFAGDNAPTKPGFTFDGWTTDEASYIANDADPTPGVPVATVDVTYYPVWRFAGTVKFFDYAYGGQSADYATSSKLNKLMVVALDVAADSALSYDGKLMYYTDSVYYLDLLDATQDGAYEGTYSKVYLYIVDPETTVAAAVAKLTVGDGTNDPVDRDGDVNDDGNIRSADWGIINDLLRMQPSAANTKDKLQADVQDSKYNDNKFGGIDDIVKTIQLKNGTAGD